MANATPSSPAAQNALLSNGETNEWFLPNVREFDDLIRGNQAALEHIFTHTKKNSSDFHDLNAPLTLWLSNRSDINVGVARAITPQQGGPFIVTDITPPTSDTHYVFAIRAW
ncbi:MAG: hypothetical protein FWD91_04410 [Treponema sp.]|nr:hypothetical protein [Treponema sp.]